MCARTRLPQLNRARRLLDGPNSPVNVRQIGTNVSHLTQPRLSGYRLHSAAAVALRDEGKALMSEFFEARIGPLSFRRNSDEQ